MTNQDNSTPEALPSSLVTEAGSTFCVLPWIHRFTNISGDVQVCCASEGYDNYVRDEAGEPINFQKAFVGDKEIMHGSYMRKVRAQLLKKEWPTACERCKITEQVGGNSRRSIENERYGKQVIDQILASSTIDGTTTMPILSHDFRLGNACNLSCRMCSPHASTSWLKDWKKMEGPGWIISDEKMQELRGIDWYKNPKIKDEIKAQLANLRHLHFAGGEPLLMPEMVKILELCVESGYSKNIELTYNTNITKIPDVLKRLWPQFRETYLLCSIDAFGDLNEYIRNGSRWADIHENLVYLDSNFKELGLSGVLIMTTTQAYNVLQLEPLYEYLANNHKWIAKLPVLTDLHWPQYYRTQVLPKELKQKARERLERIMQRAQARLQSGFIPVFEAYKLEMIRGVIGFMDLEDDEQNLPEFISQCRRKDLWRNQSIVKVVPELASIFSSSGESSLIRESHA